MPLNDFIVPGPWAITPDALESLRQHLVELSSPAALESAARGGFTGSDEATQLYQLQGSVAVIEVRGAISRRGGQFLWFSWAGQDTIKTAIEAALADPSVQAILLSFDSPGGVAAGVKELADYISAQTVKPIYAYADGLCASAAYWLASATGRFYAPATALLGSIGVIQVHCDQSVANAALGLRYTYITGGTWKAAGNPDTPLTEPELTYLQGTIGALHDIFKNDVASHMGLVEADSAAWGDGQIFVAVEAQRLGLVSGIVENREALVAKINKEFYMDKEKLASQHPELLAQIETDIKANMSRELTQNFAQKQEVHQALVILVAGDAVAAEVAKLAAVGLSLDQVKALGPHLIKPVAATGPASNLGVVAESESRQEILTALVAATPGPVASGQLPAAADDVSAAIGRIGAL